ncbi:MAG TPA: hypothetical protein VE709_13025 [Pseudonocardiaceae bacterium]|nr:hypothetical protein [Pseudonocardiaceae bacterium]
MPTKPAESTRPAESTQSIVIEAEPKAIMGVSADFSSYPQWVIGMFRRKAEKVVMDTALKELKRRIES